MTIGRSRLLQLTWFALATGCVLGVPGTVAHAAAAAATLTIERSVHFSAPGGKDVVIEPGPYAVDMPAEAQLRLTGEGKSAVVIEALRVSHAEAIATPRALAIPGDQPDTLHVVFLLPNEQGLDAVGSYSGTRPRGNQALLSASQIKLGNAQYATMETPTGGPVVLGTSAQTVQIPGNLVVGGGRMEVVGSPIGGGVVANNIYIRQLNQAGAPAHLCWKVAPDGVQALLLTICTTSQSSLRYKMDLKPYVGGMELVNRLNPVHFAWKNSGLPEIGLVAEEVAAVEPLLTFTNHKDEIEGIKYETLSVVLINALKEQQAEIRELRQQVRELQAHQSPRHP